MNLRLLELNPAVTTPAATTPAAAARSVGGQTWRQDSACQYTDPEVFFPAKGDSSLPARRICHRCPVVTQCLQWALATGESHGILGGESIRGRRAIAGLMREWASTTGLPCPPQGAVPEHIQQAYLDATTPAAA